MNKAAAPQAAVQAKKETNIPEIQRVFEIVESLNQKKPYDRNDFLQGIEQAQAAQTAAEKAKEEAETEAEFNKACDDEAHARDKEKFYLRLLDKSDHSPRMSEEDYNEVVRGVDNAVRAAADKYRQIASYAMSEVVQAKKDYERIMKDADRALIALDNSAKVLQSKYRYRVTEYTDGRSYRKEDTYEWQKHIVRYCSGRGIKYAMGDVNIKESYHKDVAAAWFAAERIER